ncbi:Structural maintenance of chromosomes protein 5 [Elasticomyces elasticus]|nr:Structural maintenance of chromosomes protein 5 [Elasticomyces elasticus]
MKRTRTDLKEDNENWLEHGLQCPEGSLLPDSFRRSPRGARVPSQHQPGSNIRVRLKNFVTYIAAEFHPGPNLNMVIGPNGTGKSTLVCAICLGLGWEPKHLSRQSKEGDFVKNGILRAKIEIELAADWARHAENPAITTIITKKGYRSKGQQVDFLINGKKKSKNAVGDLTRSFSIRVDNLCQFLPQDKVSEFAKLSPIQLLADTQRAAPLQMCEWHDQLKTMRKEQKWTLNEQQAINDELKAKEDQRQTWQARVAALEKIRPFPQYQLSKKVFKEAKDEHKKAEKDFARLQRQTEPNLLVEREKDAYLKRIEQVVPKHANMAEKSENQASNIKNAIKAKKQQIKELDGENAAAKKLSDKARQNMPGLQWNKTALERAIENKPADIDFPAYNERLREVTRQIRDIDPRREEIRLEIGSLSQNIQQRAAIIEQAEAEKASLNTHAGQQVKSSNVPLRKRTEPGNGSRSIPNAFMVKSALGEGEMIAFTATSRDDYCELGKVVHDELRLDRINIWQSGTPLANFRAPGTDEQLRSYGLKGWILDLIEGPVLAMLCDTRRIHATGYTTRDQLGNTAVAALKGPQSPITSWVTGTESFQVSRRREYGEHATSMRANQLGQARYFTDVSAAQHEDADMEARVEATQRAIEEYQQTKAELKDADIREEKNIKQKALSRYNALPTKSESAEDKLTEAREKINVLGATRREIAGRGDRLTVETGQLAIGYGNAVAALRDLIVQHMEAQILAIEARNDCEKLKEHTREEKKLLELRREVDISVLLRRRRWPTDASSATYARVLANRWRRVMCLHETHNEVKEWEPERLELKSESMHAKLEMNAGASGQQIPKAYEDRAHAIEKLSRTKGAVDAGLEALELDLTDTREQWEPKLDRLIGQISEAFAENFAKIQCAGEVSVHKDEDFEHWAIQIKVKVRENETLPILDHRQQSGSERAVSTTFYPMALQSLARAPFRVVNEINQGMDQRNEHLMHARMVDIAYAKSSASQYFLITPRVAQRAEVP